MNWYYCELSGIDRDGYFKSMIYTSIADKYENVKLSLNIVKMIFQNDLILIEKKLVLAL